MWKHDEGKIIPAPKHDQSDTAVRPNDVHKTII